MDAGRLIAEVARRDGILLDRHDPVIASATAHDMVMTEHRDAMDASATRAEVAASRFEAAAKAGMGEAQLRKFAADITENLNGGLSQLAVADQWKGKARNSAALLLAIALGAGLMWFPAYDAGHAAGHAEGYQEAQQVLVKAPELSAALTAANANKWVALIDNNPGDPSKAERGDCMVQNGRTGCYFALWIDAAGSVPSMAVPHLAGDPIAAAPHK